MRNTLTILLTTLCVLSRVASFAAGEDAISVKDKIDSGKWDQIRADLAKSTCPLPGPEAVVRTILYDTGAFCSDSEMENILLTAERFSSIAAHWRLTYPTGPFRRSWQACSTASPQTGELQDASAQAQQALDRALDTLSKRITTKGAGVPIVVFNPLSWTRTDAVVVESPFPGKRTAVKITDPDGNSYAARNIGDTLYFTARAVPAIGYKVFWAHAVDKPQPSDIKSSGYTIENQFFRVRVDPDLGVVRSIYDKRSDRPVMPELGASALLQVIRPDGSKEDLVGNTEAVLTDSGPARATITFDHEYGSSRFTEEITLYDAVPRIDLHLTADWRETPGSALNAAFSTNLKDATATFELPFDTVVRPADGAPYAALNWIDLSTSDYGVSLLADAAYCYEVQDNTMRALLIGPSDTDDNGVHETTLSLYPHKGDWRDARSIRRGLELNQPLIARLATAHAGSLPRSQSFVSIGSPNVVATAVKQAEEDIATVLRVREIRGEACETMIRVKFLAQHYFETDLVENPISEKKPMKAGKFTISLGPHEVKTFKLVRR